MHTRKYPRTLVEAFGPYANNTPLQAPKEPMPKADKIALAVSCGTLAGLVVMHVVGWLA